MASKNREVVVSGDTDDLAQEVRVGGHRLASDEPIDLGGGDTGPDPYEYLLAALGSCTSMTLQLYAKRKGWKLDRVTVSLTRDRIHAEDCADCETKVGMVDHIVRNIHLEGDLDDEQRQRLREIADKCPVHRSLTSEIRVTTALV